jgi:hypothetical protein
MYYLVLRHSEAMVCKSPIREHLEMLLMDLTPTKRAVYKIVYKKD